MKYYGIHKTKIGEILLAGDENYLSNLFFDVDDGMEQLGDSVKMSNSIFLNVTTQLDLYFSCRLKNFQIKLKPLGTDFQIKAWRALLNIPFGKAISYKEQAYLIKNPKASRAVGTANGKNPIPIIIPCHRVINSDGKLGGYSAGTEIKEELLKLEGFL